MAAGEVYNRVLRSKKEMIINNFLGGIAWGIGAFIGAGIIIAIVGYVLGKVDFIPIIGNWTTQIVEFVENSRLRR